MSNPPQTTKPASSGGGGEVLMGLGLGLIVLIGAFPAALTALWARRFMKTRQAMIALLALGGGLLFALVLLAPFTPAPLQVIAVLMAALVSVVVLAGSSGDPSPSPADVDHRAGG